MDAKWQMHIVSHTHWDREWYAPFQQFRVRLVALVEELLRIVQADRQYKHFMLDGQTVILEDYLEIQPHRLPELKQLITDGRLLIGPWYTMPELSLVGSEAIVRNLLLGHRIAKRFGGVMRVGYLPDSFGQIAQMPQILRGFGIDAAVFWRGTDDEVDRSEFIWQSPDGSEVLGVCLPFGYSNGYNLPDDEQQLLARLSHIRNQLEPFATTPHLLVMNGGDHAVPQPELPRIIAKANGLLADVEVIHSTLPDYVAAVRREGGEAGWRRMQGEFRSGRHNFVLAGVLSTRMWLKQRDFACETTLEKWAEPFSALASLLLPAEASNGRHLSTAPSLLAVAWRYLLHNHAHDTVAGCGIDQLYHEARTRYDWSQQIAETVAGDSMAALAEHVDLSRLGGDGSAVFPVLAVFNGSGRPRSDFVHFKAQLPADEQHDFVLVDDEGNAIRYQIIGQHHTDILGSDFSRNDLRAVLSIIDSGDPADWPREKIEALEAMVGMMAGEHGQKMVISDVMVRPTAQPKTVAIEINTAQSGAHNYEAIRQGLHEVYVVLSRGDVEFFQLRVRQRDEIEVGFLATGVPAFGYRCYRLLPGQRAMHRASPTSGVHTVQNEFFSVQANPLDGTLTVIDKRTGAVFEGLNAFVDGGDAGDEYNYSPPPEDQLITVGARSAHPSSPPKITLLEDGSVRSLLSVEIVVDLPLRLRADRRARTPETVPCAIHTKIVLYKGVERIEIRTEVDNRSEDHRFRVHFPTRLKATHSYAEGHYAVVQRPVTLPPPGADWMEPATGTHPQKAFVDISDGEVGLLIANRGLPEFEALSSEQGTTLALTLLRSVGWLSRDDLSTRHGGAGPAIETPEAQCLGKSTFEYAIVPHAGGWQRAYQQAHDFASPLRAIVVLPKGGSLPTRFGLLSVEPDTVVVSAVKLAEEGGGTIVRIYNPSPESVGGAIRLGLPVKSAWQVNLNEEKLQKAEVVDDATIPFTIHPAEILSFKLDISATS